MTPSMETTQTELSDFGEIGKGGFLKRLKKVALAPLKIHRTIEKKIWKATVPKPVRKQFTRKNFIKIAPILAGVAMILNVIPGLGFAVSAAILAASTAIAAADAIAARQQARADRIKVRKTTDAQANQNYLGAQQYIEANYNITYPQFQKMSLDQKAAFLNMVATDQQYGGPPPTGTSGLGQTAAGADQELNALQANYTTLATQANQQMDAAFDKSQGYFTATYNVSAAQFKAMTLDDKMNFMGVAAQDAQADQKAGVGPFQMPTNIPSKTPLPAPASPGGTSAPAGPEVPSGAVSKVPAAPAKSSSNSGLIILGLGLLGLLLFSGKKR